MRATRPRRSPSTPRSSRAARRPRRATGRRTTSRACVAWLGYGSGVHAPGHGRPARGARGRAPHAALARAAPSRCSRRDCPRARGRHRARLVGRRTPASTTPRDVRGRAAGRRRAQPLVPRPGLPRRVPGGRARALRPSTRRSCATATCSDRRADRLPRRQQLLARGRRAPTPDGGAPVDVRAPTRRAHGHGLGGLPGRALRGARSALARRVRRPRALRDRERRRVRGRPRARRRGARPRAHDVPRALPRRGRRARSTTACRCAATSSGRCSTTSSGRTATRSGSGIVYVDYPTLERVPKVSFRWYRDLIAAARGAAVPRALPPRAASLVADRGEVAVARPAASGRALERPLERRLGRAEHGGAPERRLHLE